MSTTTTHYFYQEYGPVYITSQDQLDGWISCGYGYKWTLDQCREKAMERKIVSPRSKLRIVKETREVWSWRERAKTK